MNDYYNCHFKAADEVSIYDLASQLRVFRSAYEEIEAETEADMAADCANEAAANKSKGIFFIIYMSFKLKLSNFTTHDAVASI